MMLCAITVNFFFLHRLFKRPQLLDFANHFIGEANYSKGAPAMARPFRKKVRLVAINNYSDSAVSL